MPRHILIKFLKTTDKVFLKQPKNNRPIKYREIENTGCRFAVGNNVSQKTVH